MEQIMAADGKEEDAYLDYPALLNEWLYSYPGYAEWMEGIAPYGYWPSTPFADDSNLAWFVYFDGVVGYSSVDHGNFYGVRPVITLSI